MWVSKLQQSWHDCFLHSGLAYSGHKASACWGQKLWIICLTGAFTIPEDSLWVPSMGQSHTETDGGLPAQGCHTEWHLTIKSLRPQQPQTWGWLKRVMRIAELSRPKLDKVIVKSVLSQPIHVSLREKCLGKSSWRKNSNNSLLADLPGLLIFGSPKGILAM